MSRWGKPIKNKKRRDPRYFLNENIELEEQNVEPGDMAGSEFSAAAARARARDEFDMSQGRLPAETETDVMTRQHGREGGVVSPYNDLASYAVKASEPTNVIDLKIRNLNSDEHPIMKKIAKYQSLTNRSRRADYEEGAEAFSKEVIRLGRILNRKINNLRTGPQKALARLEAAARTDSDARAILDAVYQENPNLRPKNIKQLSPEESENILDFVD